ncbi:ABC transporter ATP-binding protein [Bacteroides sp. UBA939]|uniref:ABC transporter ATP-binding protein n=1 Tax=Bacteroides sp. UBA939 TaxID=1946092 RepID=UPI0025BC15CF|nr:ABC transporter ATP-binding protein [Bacteroides sp. UBA939]
MNLSQLFRNILPYVKPYKWLVILALVLTFIGALTAQVNAYVLQYTVNSITSLLEQHKPLQEGMHIVAIISIILMAKEIVNIFISFGQKFFGEKIRIMISQDLAQQIIEKILTYRMAFFTADESGSGKLQTRIDQGVSSLTRTVQSFFIDIFPLFTSAIVALIGMFHANFYVGLVGLCIVPIYFYISQRQAQKLKGWRRNIRTYRENKSGGIINILDSINVIKSFNRENIEAKKQLDLQTALTDTQMRTRSTNFKFDGLKTFTEQFGVVIIIILTAYLVLTGQMQIGAIMLHIMLFNNVTAPIRQLHRIYDDINDALIYAEGFFDVMNSDHEKEQSGEYRPAKIRGEFELRDIDFTYPTGTQALFNVNMKIEPNKITALVGLSGAGKSTVINLLDKFYEAQRGEILLDGIPLIDYDTRYLRENIGLVLQKNHIFSGTIAENILYGNVNATREQMEDAARKAYIHEQVIALPNGYESSALALSGGQQQRIAIARMFLKNPPIIFLDEPTASLDAVATEQIKNSLDAIKKDRTVIIISHSISQIIDSDQIYVMKMGHVVESGTHEELYHMEGTYKDIFDAMARSLNIDKISKTIEED